jgi:hypothetical protein
VDAIHQIGENIEQDKPMHIIVFGKDTSNEKAPKTVALSLNSDGVIRVLA